MATAKSVKSKIQGLIATANATTGNSDTDLTTAVSALVAGFGSGGNGGDNEPGLEYFCTVFNGTVENLCIPELTEWNLFRCFDGNTSLRTIDLPDVATFGKGYVFRGCTNLTTVNLPSMTDWNSAIFENCTGLVEISFPKFRGSAGISVFSGCTTLQKAIFSNTTEINPSSYNTGFGQRVFQNCSSLTTLVLKRTTAIYPIANINVFTGTPFAEGGTGGTVYVPQALIESYQTATNWSTLYAAGTCNFVAIEGSEYE